MQKLIYSVFGLLIALLLIGLLLPSTHQVEVSVEIDATPATLFTLINDFRRHEDWSPWAEHDPEADIRYSENSRGPGATMTWNGVIMGHGSQVITASEAHRRIDIALNPDDDGEARAWFDLTPGVGTTLVTWGFEVDHGLNIVGRYFASMLGSVIARDHRHGLNNLKLLAESLPSADFAGLQLQQTIIAADRIALRATSSRPDPDATAIALRDAYFEILSFIDEHQLTVAGAPISVKRGFRGADAQFDAAIPISGGSDAIDAGTSPVRLASTYAGPALQVRHVGSYRGLGETHRKIQAYLAAAAIERAGAPWEAYVSDPADTAEHELLTLIYYPIRVD